MNYIDMTDFRTAYKPVAIYYEDGDYVEYVRKDVTCVYRRIDEFLTLALDMDDRSLLIGFRLKGFRNFFVEHLKSTYSLPDSDFISLVLAIEKAATELGNNVIKGDAREAAYDAAAKIARDDNVDVELPKAA